MGKITQTAGRNALGEFAPEFAHYNDDVLFGEYVANRRRSRLCISNRTHCIQCTSDTDLG